MSALNRISFQSASPKLSHEKTQNKTNIPFRHTGSFICVYKSLTIYIYKDLSNVDSQVRVSTV